MSTLHRTIAYLLALTVVPCWAADWQPISEADMARSEPKIQPDADAETMLWEVWV